jgi:Lon protease-like protein
MELPLFPLHLVLFPGRPLALHLFEARYRQMLRDCLDAGHGFGVIAIRSGREVGDSADTFDVGTIAAIETVVELPDGRYDIATRGLQRFRVCDLVPGTPYRKARVELLDDVPVGLREREQAAQLRSLLLPYLSALGAPDELLERLPTEPDELAYLAAAAAQVEVPEQQRLLELDGTGARLAATMQLLRREAGLTRHFGAVGSLRPAGPGGAELN